jgi:hypothetical protein
MKPFEDSILEEIDKKQKKLIMLLRKAYNQEKALPYIEQQKSIKRVEERMARMEANRVVPSRQIAENVTGTFMPGPRSRPVHSRPFMRIIGILAAVFMVSVLIGSAVLLFTQHTSPSHTLAGQTSTPGHIEPTGTPVKVNIQWAGLEMSMGVTPGPYFLGELLAVDLSLTNHTHPQLLLRGNNDGSEIHPCNSYSLQPEQTGGTSPHYLLYTQTVPIIYACTAQKNGPTFIPGQTITDHFYVLLQSSGDVTLTGVALIFSEPGRNPDLLTGHLPTLHIHVAPQVPANRTLSLQQKGSEVVIHSPQSGIHLVNQTYILCQASSNSSDLQNANPGGYTYWQPLSTNTLQRPACTNVSVWVNGKKTTTQDIIVQWKYAIGAVGYAVVQGCIGTAC